MRSIVEFLAKKHLNVDVYNTLLECKAFDYITVSNSMVYAWLIHAELKPGYYRHLNIGYAKERKPEKIFDILQKNLDSDHPIKFYIKKYFNILGKVVNTSWVELFISDIDSLNLDIDKETTVTINNIEELEKFTIFLQDIYLKINKK